jgi:hypothetical protein
MQVGKVDRGTTEDGVGRTKPLRGFAGVGVERVEDVA